MKKIIVIAVALLLTAGAAQAKGSDKHGHPGTQKHGHGAPQAEEPPPPPPPPDDGGDDGTDPWAYLYDPLTGRITDPVRCWRADIPGCIP